MGQGMLDMSAMMQQVETPANDPIDQAMKYLESGTDLSIPGYEIPSLPDSDPFSDSYLPEIGSDSKIHELPMPVPGQRYGPY